MAKNRDRRKDPKPKAPRGEIPQLRKARPDLLNRISDKVGYCPSWHHPGLSAMEIAKEMNEHVDDVSDCLATLTRQGRVEGRGDRFYPAPEPKPPKPKKPELNPAILLKIRKVFTRVTTASPSDFKGVDEIDKYLVNLAEEGFIARIEGSYAEVDRQEPRPSAYLWKGGRHRKTQNGVCPWCKKSTRRHARAEVHDLEQCRLDMIALIMSD